MTDNTDQNIQLKFIELSSYAKGIEVERKRILALIEPMTICDEDCDHYNCGTWALKEAIALIKREK